MGEEKTKRSSNPSRFGKEGQEVIIVSNDDDLLLEYENEKITNMGKNLLDVKEKLKDMGKDKNFIDLINK